MNKNEKSAMTETSEIVKEKTISERIKENDGLQSKKLANLEELENSETRKFSEIFAEDINNNESSLADMVKLIEEEGDDFLFQSVLTMGDVFRMGIDEMPCLWGEIFPSVGLITFVGTSDCGKSSCLRQFTAAICAKEKEFLGFPLNWVHGKAIYVSSEDDVSGVMKVLRKQNEALKYPNEVYDNLRYVFDTSELVTRLEKELQKEKADVIVVDCITDIYGGDLYMSNKIRSFLHDYSMLARKYQTLVICIHHTGKRTDSLAPSKHNALGSGGIEQKSRLQIEIKTDNFNPDIRHLCIVKGNYLPQEYKNESFVLEFSEHMTYTNTGRRMKFEDIGNTPEKLNNIRDEYIEIIELEEGGLSINEIAEKLGVERSTIYRRKKRYEDSIKNEGR